MSAFQPLPPAPAGDRRPLHRQQLRFEVVGVRRVVGRGRNVTWYVIDRQPWWDDHAWNDAAGSAPQHAFPTRRAALNWIVEYLLARPDHFEQLRACEYQRRRRQHERQRDDDRRPDDVDDDEVVAQTIPNTNNKGEQQ